MEEKKTGMIATFFLLTIVGCLFSLTTAQTGGTYQMEKTAAASGGGGAAAGTYSLDLTIGQPASGGFFRAGRYETYHGFWTASLAPTAANVSIGGRVMTADGRGISNARVILTAIANGGERSSRSSSFGYYRFDDVQVGETYFLIAISKQFQFESRVVTVNDEIADLDFIAIQ